MQKNLAHLTIQTVLSQGRHSRGLEGRRPQAKRKKRKKKEKKKKERKKRKKKERKKERKKEGNYINNVELLHYSVVFSNFSIVLWH